MKYFNLYLFICNRFAWFAEQEPSKINKNIQLGFDVLQELSPKCLKKIIYLQCNSENQLFFYHLEDNPNRPNHKTSSLISNSW